MGEVIVGDIFVCYSVARRLKQLLISFGSQEMCFGDEKCLGMLKRFVLVDQISRLWVCSDRRRMVTSDPAT